MKICNSNFFLSYFILKNQNEDYKISFHYFIADILAWIIEFEFSVKMFSFYNIKFILFEGNHISIQIIISLFFLEYHLIIQFFKGFLEGFQIIRFYFLKITDVCIQHFQLLFNIILSYIFINIHRLMFRVMMHFNVWLSQYIIA